MERITQPRKNKGCYVRVSVHPCRQTGISKVPSYDSGGVNGVRYSSAGPGETVVSRHHEFFGLWVGWFNQPLIQKGLDEMCLLCPAHWAKCAGCHLPRECAVASSLSPSCQEWPHSLSASPHTKVLHQNQADLTG